ncbi:MAG TPA: FAD/NAD(P)-binding protein [Chloroflexota bacterium]
MFTEHTRDFPSLPATTRQPMLPNPWRIRSFRRETYDTFTIDLTPGGDPSPFSFLPGQFNMMYVFGVGEVPISISGDAANPEVLTHTVRAVGTVTRAMSEMKRGQVLGVRGPYGTPWPVREARGKDVVIACGGIGLAPLRPAIYHLLHHREEYGRIAVLYGARTPRDMLYVSELEEWRGRFDVDVAVTVDSAQPDWRGNVGVVTTLVPLARFNPDDTIAMICGPEIMMRFMALELQKRGLSNDAIYLSMERNMKCALGYCGHCQYGPTFICKDGAVFPYGSLARLMRIREV